MTEESGAPPRYLFLDTEYFEGIQFDFQNSLLKAVAIQAEANQLQLILPKVIEEEIRAHLRQKALDAAKQTPPALLRNSRLESVKQRLAPLDVEALVAEASADLDDLLRRCNVIRLDTDLVPLSRIQLEYLAKRPPFAGRNAKAQFPDGFAIASMLDWAAAAPDRSIVVVTRDDQIKEACVVGGPLLLVDLVEHLKALQASQLARAAAGDAAHEPEEDDDDELRAEALERLEALVRSGLAEHRDKITAEARRQFEELGFYVTGVDGDVEEVEVEGVEFDDDVDFLAIDPNDALVEIQATFEFKADVTYRVPSTGTYDSELGELLFQDESSTTVNDSVSRSILVAVAIEEDEDRVFCSIGNVSIQSGDIRIENPDDDGWPYK